MNFPHERRDAKASDVGMKAGTRERRTMTHGVLLSLIAAGQQTSLKGAGYSARHSIAPDGMTVMEKRIAFYAGAKEGVSAAANRTHAPVGSFSHRQAERLNDMKHIMLGDNYDGEHDVYRDGLVNVKSTGLDRLQDLGETAVAADRGRI